MHQLKTRFKLTGVNKQYPGNPPIQALKNLNLELFEGCITALTGESGCGKSTLARILIRLEPYDSGVVLYFDQILETVDLKEFRTKNRIMFQSPSLAINPTFKIAKVISEPLEIYQETFPANRSRATIFSRRYRAGDRLRDAVAEVMDIMELPLSYLEQYPAQLSGGELQRVALARALLPQPQYLILDEPFAHLDELDTKRLIKHLKQLFSRFNMGILLISHNMHQVDSLAHHIIHM